ncbi:MAG: precorrin-6A reductase [Hungatella sp.]|nr:precorrin-6A reductase [Hungatella sp.]
MKEILVFAGTTEGRQLSEILAASRIMHTVCVATEYGEMIFAPHPLRTVHCGRMDQAEIETFIQSGNFGAVVDATHPYAKEVTENIWMAVKGRDLPYLRLKRETSAELTQEHIRRFDSNEECAKALEETEGNILLTTGSRELSKYCISEEVKRRLYVRVLPSIESISVCMEQGLAGKQIIAMQGPFTAQMNEAMLHQYKIACMVTKESGRQGGFQEKLEAAKKTGIPVFLVGLQKEVKGYSMEQVCEKLSEICGKSLKKSGFMWITLGGIGMGNEKNLTREVKESIEKADILLGSERVIASWKQCPKRKPFYQAKQIIPYLKEVQKEQEEKTLLNVTILFSGDSGFYSGCQSVYHALKREIECKGLNASLRILPGISSVSYLAACTGESYDGAAIYSIHGKEVCNLAQKIKRNEKTFLLMSGVKDVNRLGRLLTEEGMGDCQVVAGYQLSYENQQINDLTPEECCQAEEEGLYTCLVKNPNTIFKCLTPNHSDQELIRERIPMTKEEVRLVSICKLKLHKGAVVYDIGSGTGSVAVEIAGLSDEIQVYALERKPEAVDLIKRNKVKFGLENITVIQTEAPDGLERLPVATHAFIGGSGGRLKEIIECLYHRNSCMRVVINAVSVETICQIREILGQFSVKNWEIVQLQVSRTKEAGEYHLMKAENPVWISGFNFGTKSHEHIF